jgi:hypothetical protein
MRHMEWLWYHESVFDSPAYSRSVVFRTSLKVLLLPSAV